MITLVRCPDETATIVNGRWICHCTGTPASHNGRPVRLERGRYVVDDPLAEPLPRKPGLSAWWEGDPTPIDTIHVTNDAL